MATRSYVAVTRRCLPDHAGQWALAAVGSHFSAPGYLQLSFAVIPLVRFTSDRFKMGEFANSWWLTALAWIVAVIIGSLNGWLLVQTGMGWLER